MFCVIPVSAERRELLTGIIKCGWKLVIFADITVGILYQCFKSWSGNCVYALTLLQCGVIKSVGVWCLNHSPNRRSFKRLTCCQWGFREQRDNFAQKFLGCHPVIVLIAKIIFALRFPDTKLSFEVMSVTCSLWDVWDLPLAPSLLGFQSAHHHKYYRSCSLMVALCFLAIPKQTSPPNQVFFGRFL